LRQYRVGFIGAAMIGSLAAGTAGATGATAATTNAATTRAAATYAAPTTSQTRVIAGHDAYISSTRRTYNTGQVDKLVAGRSAGETRKTYLRFNVGALPAGAKITKAELKLVTDGHAIPGTVTVSKVASTTWSEKTLTASNAPAIGAAVASVKPAAGATSVTLDLSKVVTRPGVYSFAVASSATNDVARFRSTESSTASAPGLKITTVTPPAECAVDAKLVPSCGVLWGAAAGGFTATPRDQAIQEWEATSGRTATIWHQYHRGDELFPTKAEIAMARDPEKPRILLINWKVAEGTTWAKVAAGQQNARIDRLAAHLLADYTEKFFLAPHHEPENDVIPTAGSGMTAKDYSAMYRHVVKRLQAKGVTNAVNVVAYMGNEKWMAQPWWNDLYPGDDVVDWIGLDSYVNAQPGGYHHGDFAALLDRAPTGGGTGFYEWATTRHPNEPLMIAEWGVYHSLTRPADKAAVFNTVLPELKKRPAIKAMVYFDTPRDDQGDRDISINSSPAALTAFRAVAADPIFNVKVR